MRAIIRGLSLLVVTFALAGCSGDDDPVPAPLSLTRLKVDRTYLRDSYGRYVLFHGVNVSGSTKVPTGVSAAKVPTYVGKPFALDKADEQFKLLRDAGFNMIRLLVIWEGIEPVAKGNYDKAYLAYLRDIVKKADEYGIYVLLDMHQDIFSRHLVVRFNDQPEYGDPGSVEHALLSLVKEYNAAVQGDGAPAWAVQTCLPEKKMSSAFWGTPRILSGMDLTSLMDIFKLYQKLTGGSSTDPTPDWVPTFLFNLPGTFKVEETTDLLPFTNWGLAHLLSLDVARSFACLLAGDKAFPKLIVGGRTVKDYLQEAYANAWLQVVEQVKDLPNVIGYDIINEPGGNFIVLSAVAGMIKMGVVDGAKSALVNLLGTETGEELYKTLLTLRLLPPDIKPETLKSWGLDQVDVLAVLGMNNGFDENFLRPFFERVGQAILKADPQSLLFLEGTLNVGMITGGFGGLGGFWEVPMQHPRGEGFKNRVVWAPHWYPDIYPFLGFNVDPRTFTAEQVRYRDYKPKLEEARALADYSLGKIPVVFGEFGTYFNYNNTTRRDAKTGKQIYTNWSKAKGYSVSSHILNNYYEAFESMFQSNTLWCYSPENDERKGDLWNREDFSVLGPDRKLRSELAWSRPFARALAGKPLSTHFHSDFHYFDPDKGIVSPVREFEVRYGSKETSAPSEIFVPRVQYPDGFYVWISDGFCHYDHERSILYHYPTTDEPGTVHRVRLLGPLDRRENEGWSYFFKDEQKVGRK